MYSRQVHKFIYLFIFSIFLVSLVVALEPTNSPYGLTQSETEIEAGANYTINVNNSNFWAGYTPATLPHNILANLLWSVAGHTIDADIDMNAYQLTDMHSLILSGTGYLGDWDGILNTASHFAPTGDLLVTLGTAGLRWANFSVMDIFADGTESYFNSTLRIDADTYAEGNATLVINSNNNDYSCINLTEQDAFGFTICNDGSGSNRFVIGNYATGFEYMWIDRDDGTIHFNNDTVFTTISLDTINATDWSNLTSTLTSNPSGWLPNNATENNNYITTGEVSASKLNAKYNAITSGSNTAVNGTITDTSASAGTHIITGGDFRASFPSASQFEEAYGVRGVASSVGGYATADMFGVYGSADGGLNNWDFYSGGSGKNYFPSINSTDWSNATSELGDTFVPYTGATSNVDLGVYNLSLGGLANITSGESATHDDMRFFANDQMSFTAYNRDITFTTGSAYPTINFRVGGSSMASINNFNLFLNPSGANNAGVFQQLGKTATNLIYTIHNMSLYIGGPTASSALGLKWQMNLEDTSGGLSEAGGIVLQWTDPTAGTQDASMKLKTVQDGTVKTSMDLNGSEMISYGNHTITDLIKLNVMTLPLCNIATNGTIGRNITGVYGCSHNAIWTQLF